MDRNSSADRRAEADGTLRRKNEKVAHLAQEGLCRFESGANRLLFVGFWLPFISFDSSLALRRSLVQPVVLHRFAMC